MERISDVPSRVFDLRPVGIVALAAAMVWSTWIVADTYHSIKVKPEQRTIRVTGSAKKRIVSDLIEWSATLEGRAARSHERVQDAAWLHRSHDRVSQG